jgi:hypothetical protein
MVEIGRTVDQNQVKSWKLAKVCSERKLSKALCFRAWSVVACQRLVRWDEKDTINRCRLRERRIHAEKHVVGKQSGGGLVWIKRLDEARPEKALTQRSLRIGVDEQDTLADVREMPSQVKTSRALPASSLLIDQT